MDGLVNHPQEMSPLAPGTLLSTLQSATSSSQLLVQAATHQLQTWETERGYHALLQGIFNDRTLALDVRYLAIIQLKNGIDKYWRKTATSVICNEEKDMIRSHLLQSGIAEENRLLALQNALVTAKVVRFDYPKEWPDVIPSLVIHLRATMEPASNKVALPRTLLVLLYIIKELATARLQRSRASLQSATPEIFSVLQDVYERKAHQWQTCVATGQDDEGIGFDALDQSLLALKILRRLLLSGYEYPNRDESFCRFWLMANRLFTDLTALVTSECWLAEDVKRAMEKHALQLAKFHVELARDHPAAFALLPDSMSLVQTYQKIVFRYGEQHASAAPTTTATIKSDGDEEGEKSILETLALKGLLLLRACVKMVFNPTQTFKYRPDEAKAERKRAVDLVRAAVLEPGHVISLMEVLVTRLFIFRESDLREWREEPEEWERREESEGDGWEYSIRPCAEKLFLDLIINFKDTLAMAVLDAFRLVSTNVHTNIFYKEAIYAATGLGAAVLHPILDFQAFLQSQIVFEVQQQTEGSNILRRRIAILLGQWVVVEIPRASRPLVYQIFQHLLDKNDRFNDHVVRVTAGKHFKHVAAEWEFNADDFLPYAEKILSAILSLIEEVELQETRMALLETVSTIVERMGTGISPFADRIVCLLQPLWDVDNPDHFLKQQLLEMMRHLVNALREGSQRYLGHVVQLISYAVAPGSEIQVYLLESALELWGAMLTQAPTSSAAEVLVLAPALFPVFQLGTENLRMALDILKSYLILAPADMLATEMRTRLCSSLGALLDTLNTEGTGMVTHIVELLIGQARRLGGAEGHDIIASTLVESGLLGKVMDGLQANHEAHQTTGPKRKLPRLDSLVETGYFCVLARLILPHPTLFPSLLARLPPSSAPAKRGDDDGGDQRHHHSNDYGPAGAGAEGAEQTLTWLLDEWFAHFENMGHPGEKKLACLALTSLLETEAPCILDRMQDLITVWTDVITEVREDSDHPEADNLILVDTNPNPNGPTPPIDDALPAAPEDERKRQLLFADPVHSVNTTLFVRDVLQRAVRRCAGDDADANADGTTTDDAHANHLFRARYLARVDPDVLSAFGELRVW
ncbi:MAG: hypothetical protein M1826_004663 [Phylliscum demangeonii]|nr:MAG: hypothetical protein M1826_004663 [Phylliscum demangeonii]